MTAKDVELLRPTSTFKFAFVLSCFQPCARRCIEDAKQAGLNRQEAERCAWLFASASCFCCNKAHCCTTLHLPFQVARAQKQLQKLGQSSVGRELAEARGVTNLRRSCRKSKYQWSPRYLACLALRVQGDSTQNHGTKGAGFRVQGLWGSGLGFSFR